MIKSLVYLIFLPLIRPCTGQPPHTLPLVCPYDSQRYTFKQFVLAIEDYPFGLINGELFEGVPGAVPQLESLILRNNSIHTVFPDSFLHVRSLKCVDLSRNFLTMLTESMFRGLRNLETLILRNNSISRLSHSVFISVSTLRTLDLSGNGLKSIEDASFRGLDLLEELILDDNELEYLPPLLFHHTPSLTILRINRNPLNFVDISFLPTLFLAQFTHARFRVLPKLPKTLVEVDMRANNLTTVRRPQRGENFGRFEAFFQGNPLDCSSCGSLTWLNHWRISENEYGKLGNLSNLRCASPFELRKAPLIDIFQSKDCNVNVVVSTQLPPIETTKSILDPKLVLKTKQINLTAERDTNLQNDYQNDGLKPTNQLKKNVESTINISTRILSTATVISTTVIPSDFNTVKVKLPKIVIRPISSNDIINNNPRFRPPPEGFEGLSRGRVVKQPLFPNKIHIAGDGKLNSADYTVVRARLPPDPSSSDSNDALLSDASLSSSSKTNENGPETNPSNTLQPPPPPPNNRQNTAVMNTVSILLAVVFAVGFFLIFVVLFIALKRYKERQDAAGSGGASNSDHGRNRSVVSRWSGFIRARRPITTTVGGVLMSGGNRRPLNGGVPVYTVTPMRDDIIMRPTYSMIGSSSLSSHQSHLRHAICAGSGQNEYFSTTMNSANDFPKYQNYNDNSGGGGGIILPHSDEALQIVERISPSPPSVISLNEEKELTFPVLHDGRRTRSSTVSGRNETTSNNNQSSSIRQTIKLRPSATPLIETPDD